MDELLTKEVAKEVVSKSKKPVISLGLYTPKQRAVFKLNQATKALAHLIWFVLYNTVCILGWIGITQGQHDNQVINQINEYSAYVIYGAGHLTLNGVQGVVAWFTKRPKYDKKIYDVSGNPQLKKSVFRIIMWAVVLIPLIVWCIGMIIINIKYKNQEKEKKVKELAGVS